ncbi:hypothetical protein PAECIP112173_00824 [Paenibacillus sp. JJ-100]|uniref:hypothetical protein n=1 Tax=Paenibacillus sp. JJ-100 TaxID=2974896 RepID=UPI0022FF5DFB|nr:hypothetical protein [Paenibacillus sp. JJ-100]CAI6036077.1 hypothetical protein PAECIP112173_00824 [Paenibacillus sp. JJ-100]
MAFCIQFQLISVNEGTAVYAYGDCSENLEGRFELNLGRLMSGEVSMDTDMREVVRVTKPCLSDGGYQHKANRAFSKIYKHYVSTSTYLKEGGYYA